MIPQIGNKLRMKKNDQTPFFVVVDGSSLRLSSSDSHKKIKTRIARSCGREFGAVRFRVPLSRERVGCSRCLDRIY